MKKYDFKEYVETLYKYLVTPEMIENKYIDKTKKHWEPNPKLSADINHKLDSSRYIFYQDFNRERLKQMKGASNASFESDFRKLLKSKYCFNRFVVIHPIINHMQITHIMLPPIKHIFKDEQSSCGIINNPELLKLSKNNATTIITCDESLTRGKGAEELIQKHNMDMKKSCLGVSRRLPKLKHLYVAHINFSSKYIPYTIAPYSKIVIYQFNEQHESKTVAIFENNKNITVCGIS